MLSRAPSTGPTARSSSTPDTERRTVPLVRDDGTTTAFTIPEFVSEPRDLEEIAHIVIAACERWENRQGVGG